MSFEVIFKNAQLMFVALNQIDILLVELFNSDFEHARTAQSFFEIFQRLASFKIPFLSAG